MFQLREYYVRGELDSCDGRWADLWRCFAIKRAEREGTDAPKPLSAREAGRGRGGVETRPMWETADAARAGREWRKLFGANVPSEKELREAEREVLAKLATERGKREGGNARG